VCKEISIFIAQQPNYVTSAAYRLW